MRALRILLALSILSCAHTPSATSPPSVVLVESAPVETTLDHADIPNASDVWLKMIESSKHTLDFAEFYASDDPSSTPSRLAPIVSAIEAAADRGVLVRFLYERSFYEKYPTILDRFHARPGITTRVFDASKTMGGILHAKYFLVDGRDVYLGSQNFDWRSLSHIQEIGVHVDEPSVVHGLLSVFDADWDAMGNPPSPHWSADVTSPKPVRLGDLSLTFAASPKGYLPKDVPWELPMIISRIDEAHRSIRVQSLTYKTKSRDGSAFIDLDDALRRAASRGVHVELMVSSWGAKDDSLRALALAGIAVRVITIPKWSGGDVPFARVAHAKYMVADDERVWIGTSNWEGDYFSRSRNVSLFVDGASFAARALRVFDDGWNSVYASPLS